MNLLTEITSGFVAVAVLSVLRCMPQQAKFSGIELFGKLYDKIFIQDLNGAQIIVSVLLQRIADKHCDTPSDDDPNYVCYGANFLAMQMGKKLSRDMSTPLKSLNHRNFNQAKDLIEKNGEGYFREAITDIDNALHRLYGGNEISLQQLSATFRRGDLLELLD